MKTVDDLKVGDQVWWTDVNRKGIHTGNVSKIGRKLVTVGEGWSVIIFRKDTMHANGAYSSHQRLIVDLQEHEDRQAVDSILLAIRNMRGGSRDIPLADAEEAARLLRVEIDRA